MWSSSLSCLSLPSPRIIGLCHHTQLSGLFFFVLGVWTQDLQLEPLHQPFFMMGSVWDRVLEQFAWAGFKPWYSWSLLPESLGLQAWATSVQLSEIIFKCYSCNRLHSAVFWIYFSFTNLSCFQNCTLLNRVSLLCALISKRANLFLCVFLFQGLFWSSNQFIISNEVGGTWFRRTESTIVGQRQTERWVLKKLRLERKVQVRLRVDSHIGYINILLNFRALQLCFSREWYLIRFVIRIRMDMEKIEVRLLLYSKQEVMMV
jgi:hypothetical protein